MDTRVLNDFTPCEPIVVGKEILTHQHQTIPTIFITQTNKIFNLGNREYIEDYGWWICRHYANKIIVMDRLKNLDINKLTR